MIYSAALTSATSETLATHLARADRQEDLCFALWRPSQGRERLSALVDTPILPRAGERNVHGNVSFEPQYFERALGLALEHEAGLAFLHAHPGGRGWQEMSADDLAAERGRAPKAQAATGLPLLGLTLATGDGGWSARLWEKTAPRTYARRDCECVRIVGGQLVVTYDDRQRPRPRFRVELERTVSAWGEAAQAHLARLRVGVVGAGSVGALVAEALARMGVERILLIDFDTIKDVNRDRLLHSSARDVRLGRAKVDSLARGLGRGATAATPRIEPCELSVAEPAGFSAALDCDVLFSCVDRPWPRYVLNVIAYAHLIPIVDGGVAVERTRRATLRGADWKAHVAAPGRRCLECLGQYDPGLVQTERDGFFDDPDYIERLPDDHPIKRNENVFAFALSCAGLEIGQFLSMVIAPNGVADYGAQNYHFVTGTVHNEEAGCEPNCPFPALAGRGDRAGIDPTGYHRAAVEARAARAALRHQPQVRMWRAFDRIVERTDRLGRS
jgi:molybdopterin/thiamine biosynthesis adenylyltransferase